MVIKITIWVISFLEGWFPMIRIYKTWSHFFHSRIALMRIAQWMKIWGLGPPISLKKAFGWNFVPWSLVLSFQRTCKMRDIWRIWPIFTWKLSRLKVFKFLWSNGIMNETLICLIISSSSLPISSIHCPTFFNLFN